jgi:uncharacterized protein (DUF1501 family)
MAPVLLNNVYARPSSPLKLMAALGNTDNILILVQLFGGNDGLNTIIPADDDTYYSLRPNIGIAKSNLASYNFGGIYFNPGLANGSQGGLFQMFKTGTLAIVQGIGYDTPNLSHFRSTDIWLSGINDSNPQDLLSTGWLGRTLEKLYPNFPSQLPSDPLAINLGGFSLALAGNTGNTGIVVDNPSTQAGGLSSADDALDTNAAGTRYETEYAFVQTIAQMSNTYATRVKTAYSSGVGNLTSKYGTDTLGQQMKTVAALIAGGLDTRVYVVGMGGFDTHIQQAEPDGTGGGTQMGLLGQLADGVAQFQADMTQLGSSVADRVIGFTVSEFGRRPHDNGSNGTDHGAASVQFAFGSRINGGIFFKEPDLSHLDDNGDLVKQVDFRSVYLTLLTDWFGMTLTDAQTVMQNQLDLPNPMGGLIKSVAGSVNEIPSLSLCLSVYPNPMQGSGNISLTVPNAGYSELSIVSMDGKTIQQLFGQTLVAGTYTIPFATDVSSGTYLLSLRSGNEQVARVIEILR